MNDQQRDRWTDGSIVSQAAAVLAEEVQSLAAGSVSKVSSLLGAGGPTNQAPVDQFRDQARSLVDTLARTLGVPSDRLPQLVTQMIAGSKPRGNGIAENVLLLRSSQPVEAGGVARLPLRLVNDDTAEDECGLVFTDLIGINGNRIPASHVRVSPGRTKVPSHGSADVTIEVRVPSGTPAGNYTGFVQADDGEALRALVTVSVAQ